MSDHFRRSDPRYDRRIEVEIIAEGQSVIAHTRNISLGGMLVEMRTAIPMKTALRVRFKVPTQPEAIEATGEVRWVETEAGNVHCIGIRFNGLRAREVWALNRFFQS